VSAIDPVQLFKLIRQPAVEPLAKQVRGMLVAALAAM